MRSGFLQKADFVGDISKNQESQSLLNEVWFPTFKGNRWDYKSIGSQSLLNEVWFPTTKKGGEKVLSILASQSLLNEVWFPTKCQSNTKKARLVAIPSKWGLVSYYSVRSQVRYWLRSQSLLNEVWFPTNEETYELDIRCKGVAIPSKWGLVSYFWHRNELWTVFRVAIPSKWGLVSYVAVFQGDTMLTKSRNPF